METENAEAEIIRGMEPFVRTKLVYLVGDRRNWWASQFFNYMETKKADDDERLERLNALREEARSLSDAELVVLVGNGVTEEALPNYARNLSNLFPDQSGVSEDAWRLWSRGWVAEEKMHGRVLDRYLLLGGRVNMKAVDGSIDSLIERGMEGQPSLLRGLIYPAFQELATALSHMNMAKIAKIRDAQSLHKICSKIAGDEKRHGAFYSEVVAELMRLAPERTIIAFGDLMRDNVLMPAANMTDDTYTEPPTLFEHFAGVASKTRVYTTRDYADILEGLNKTFQIEGFSVTGAAAKAQDYLCELPKRLRRVAERTKFRIADPVGFDWIYGRAA